MPRCLNDNRAAGVRCSEGLGPPRPQFRIASLVKNCEHDDFFLGQKEEHAVRKSPREGATDAASNHRKG